MGEVSHDATQNEPETKPRGTYSRTSYDTRTDGFDDDDRVVLRYESVYSGTTVEVEGVARNVSASSFNLHLDDGREWWVSGDSIRTCENSRRQSGREKGKNGRTVGYVTEFTVYADAEEKPELVTDGGTDESASDRFETDDGHPIREGQVVAYRPIRKHQRPTHADTRVGVVKEIYSTGGHLCVGGLDRIPRDEFEHIYHVRGSAPEAFNPSRTPTLYSLTVTRTPSNGRISGITAEVGIYGPGKTSSPTKIVARYGREDVAYTLASVRQKGPVDAGTVTNPDAVCLATDILASCLPTRIPDVGPADIPTFSGDISPMGEEWEAFLDRLRELQAEYEIQFEADIGV